MGLCPTFWDVIACESWSWASIAILLPARYLQRCCCFGGPIPAEADSSVAELQISFWIDSEHFSFHHGREESWVKLLNLHFDVLCGGVFDVFTGRAMGLRAQLLFTICSFLEPFRQFQLLSWKESHQSQAGHHSDCSQPAWPCLQNVFSAKMQGPLPSLPTYQQWPGLERTSKMVELACKIGFHQPDLEWFIFGLDSWWLKGSGSDRKIAILDKNKAGRLVGRSTRETSESNWVGSGVKKRYYQK